MYIQITSRCNMTCAHCCSGCTEDGEDMTLETFRKALEWVDDSLSIGGGEPTLHPLFWQMLGESIAACDYPWLATNGSQTRTALALAKMAQKGIIGCALSQDNYHDPIDGEVIQAFTKEPNRHSGFENATPDAREIRNVTEHEINSGRCDFGSAGCVCTDVSVLPDGTVKGCGCSDAPIFGNINDADFRVPDEWQWGECSKDQDQS